MTMDRMKMRLAVWLLSFIRNHLVPSGHSWKYALRLPVLNKVNYITLPNAPIFDGETVVGYKP